LLLDGQLRQFTTPACDPVSTRPKIHRKSVLAIFILSGAAGLIYEVVWARQLVLVFGNTTQAVATILTGFFGGMAIGSVLGGWLADRVRSPLGFYGAIELVLVGIVLATPTSFRLLHEVYRSAFTSLEATPGAITLIRFGLALIALAPATILMGSTLPMLSRFLARRRDELGGAFGNLYVANTLGAVVGTVLAGFLLIEIFCLTGTLLIGATCTGTAGLLALVFSLRSSDLADESITPLAAAATGPALDQPNETRTVETRWGLAIASAFVMGLTSLGCQVLWTRLLSLGTGNTTYVFTLILTIFLIGLALGAQLIARRPTRPDRVIALLGYAQLLVAILAVAGVVFMSGHVMTFVWPIARFSMRFVAPTALVTFPTTVVMGLCLPLASCLVGKGDERVGRDVGLLLAANTIGIIIGTSVVPFLLVPVLGSPRSVIALSTLNAGLGVLLLKVARQTQVVPRWGRVAGAMLALGVVAILLVRSPFIADPSETMVARNGELFASTEDAVASVQAGRVGEHKQLWVGGTSMTRLTVDTPLMAFLPMMIRPEADSMLVICFGMGSAFRSALIGGLRTDEVELIPSVPKMFNYYHADGDRFLSEPKARLVITDGRNYVELTDRKYDVIVVDPPPPIESSGTAELYSREFYTASASRLKDGGLMMEWMPYAQSVDEFRAHVRTFGDAFAQVIIAFSPGHSGTYMFGSSKPIHLDEVSIRKVLARPGVLEDLAWEYDSPGSTVDDWVRLIPKLVWISNEDVARFGGEGPLITDDRPLTEYFLLRRGIGPRSPDASEQNLWAAAGGKPGAGGEASVRLSAALQHPSG
jgi:spermidine synthase